MNRKIYDSTQEVLSILPERTRDILSRRFGIGEFQPETLESIGISYGITRERVRQIEQVGLQNLKKSTARQYLRPLLSQLYQFIQEHGGVAEERFLIEKFHESCGLKQKELEQEEGCLKLFLELTEEVSAHQGDDYFHLHWALQKEARAKMSQALQDLVSYFQKTGELLSFSQISELIDRYHGPVGEKPVISYLAISRLIEANAFGEYGLKDWAEVNPRGIKDKSFLVLRHIGKPLHFRELAEQINYFGLGKRPALPQTVHNELIKDPRFVLVGRGIYALSSWGYQPGTVRDVLVSLLNENGAMSQEELIEQTLKQRQVKPNTILLNLHNRSEFKRLKNGKYVLND